MWSKRRSQFVFLYTIVVVVEIVTANVIVNNNNNNVEKEIEQQEYTGRENEVLKDNKIQDGDEYVNVKTECGLVQGKMIKEKVFALNKTVNTYEFRNIPYAVPPVGALRWRPPVQLNKDPSKCWNGTLEYTKDIIACKQINPREPHLQSTEDCLFLTVRTTSVTPSKKKLPVLVWFHGGGMIWGYNEMHAFYPDTEFSAYMEAVTVSVNYRLNIFGFLSLEELWIESGPNRSYGNYGIMDQICLLYTSPSPRDS